MVKIWASDPPYDIKGEFWNIQIKKAIVPELGFGTMPKPLQKPHPPIHISVGTPNSSSARMAAQRGWGIISGPNAPTCSVASHWKVYADACRTTGIRPRGDNWRVARNVIVAPTDSEAEARVFGPDTANRYFFTYLRTAVAKAGRLDTIKPRPMTDEEFSPDVLMKECAIYGSPKTVLDKLIAYRDAVGPFGTVLKMGVDWGGASEVWEREAMTLLANEVMPKFRQHAAAEAAE
jgi:alkanesulfonate monooxygenase SsuD/methylene tetrahydromethanopterin reductase-like flavin-dependent oxidoreductase (luciferase family)